MGQHGNSGWVNSWQSSTSKICSFQKSWNFKISCHVKVYNLQISEDAAVAALAELEDHDEAEFCPWAPPSEEEVSFQDSDSSESQGEDDASTASYDPPALADAEESEADSPSSDAASVSTSVPANSAGETKEEKLKAYWSKYVVKRSFHNPAKPAAPLTPESQVEFTSPASPTQEEENREPMSEDESDGEGSMSMDENLPKRHIAMNVKRVDGDHDGGISEHECDMGASSDESETTLILGEPRKPKGNAHEVRNPKAEPYEGSSDSEVGSDDSDGSEVSYKELVSESDLNKALGEAFGDASEAAHERAINSGPSSSSTMNTPKCERPDFWGFPLVETPPKVDDSQLLLLCGCVASTNYMHYIYMFLIIHDPLPKELPTFFAKYMVLVHSIAPRRLRALDVLENQSGSLPGRARLLGRHRSSALPPKDQRWIMLFFQRGLIWFQQHP